MPLLNADDDASDVLKADASILFLLKADASANVAREEEQPDCRE